MKVEVAVPNSPYGLCGRQATLNFKAEELCESRGGRPGLPVLYYHAALALMISDVGTFNHSVSIFRVISI